MNIQEYLKQCSVGSVDELTDEQVIAYITKENVGLKYTCLINSALTDLDRHEIAKSKILASVRKFIQGYGDFKFYLVDNESSFGPSNNKTRWVVEP